MLAVFTKTIGDIFFHSRLHLGLLLLDTAVLCLLPQVCFQLPFRITRCEALSSSRLGGMVAVVSTALRILDPLVGHCSSRKQQSKHALRGLKKRREERVRAEPESSPQAIQNSLSGLSIGRAANGMSGADRPRMSRYSRKAQLIVATYQKCFFRPLPSATSPWLRHNAAFCSLSHNDLVVISQKQHNYSCPSLCMNVSLIMFPCPQAVGRSLGSGLWRR